MGMMKEIAISIVEYFEQHPDELELLETLSEEDFVKNPLAMKIAEILEISVDLLFEGIERDPPDCE